MSVMVIFVRSKHTSQKGHGITLVIVTAKTWSVLRTFPSVLSMLVPFLHDPFFWLTTVVRIFFRRDILCSSLPRGVFACYCCVLRALCEAKRKKRKEDCVTAVLLVVLRAF
jgi:hypothetical protein